MRRLRTGLQWSRAAFDRISDAFVTWTSKRSELEVEVQSVDVIHLELGQNW